MKEKSNPNPNPNPNRKPGPRTNRRNRGVALIAVLWVVMLLSVIAGSLLMLTRTELGLSRNLVRSAKAEALAEGGVHLAIFHLLDTGPDTRWRGDGARHEVSLDAGTLEITVRDTAGLIDVNAAPPVLLAGLFRAAGLEAEEAATLAGRLADWRDTDESTSPRGAEQADYNAMGLETRVGNAPFLTADEIQRVPGMTPDLYPRIAQAITVQSRRGGIDPASAPRLALMALPGVDEASADAVVTARDEARAGEPTGNSTPNLAGLLPAEARAFLTRGTGRIFHIRSHAIIPDGGTWVLEAIIELAPGADPPWRVHAWRPGTVFPEGETGS